RAAAANDEQPAGIAHRQRAQQYRVDETEERGVRPDAERERQDGGGGEARRSTEPSQSVRDVGAQLVDDPQPARVAALLFPTKVVAELAAGARVGFLARQPGGGEVVGAGGLMKPQLLVEIALEPRAQDERLHDSAKAIECPHISSGSARTMPEMAA